MRIFIRNFSHFFIKFILILILSQLSTATLFAEANEKLTLPLDLSKLNWYVKQGFNPNDTQSDSFDKTNYQKVINFPIILNSIFKIPISFGKVNEFTLQCDFELNLERIDKGKELAFLFSGIGETWEIYLNGENIKDEFDFENNEIKKYKTVRNTIITIPYQLIKEKNILTIHTAGFSPVSFLAPNSLSGLRFKDGYILDYEKRQIGRAHV